MNRIGTLAALLALLALGTGCNGSDLAAVTAPSNGADGPDGGVDPNDPHNGGEDAPGPGTVPTDWDHDGDGIPDTEDHIPCMAFYVKVWNQDVSSAEINLNAQAVVDQAFFPTDDVIVEFINPVPGVNTIDFGGKVAGSPEDELHTEIWDTAGVIYLHETIIRGNGHPEEVVLTFDIDVQC